MKTGTLTDRMEREHKTICEFCGTEKAGLSFCIGASNKSDWCMVEGTGKMSCPDCYIYAMQEGQTAINKHIADYNKG